MLEGCTHVELACKGSTDAEKLQSLSTGTLSSKISVVFKRKEEVQEAPFTPPPVKTWYQQGRKSRTHVVYVCVCVHRWRSTSMFERSPRTFSSTSTSKTRTQRQPCNQSNEGSDRVQVTFGTRKSKYGKEVADIPNTRTNIYIPKMHGEVKVTNCPSTTTE